MWRRLIPNRRLNLLSCLLHYNRFGISSILVLTRDKGSIPKKRYNRQFNAFEKYLLSNFNIHLCNLLEESFTRKVWQTSHKILHSLYLSFLTTNNSQKTTLSLSMTSSLKLCSLSLSLWMFLFLWVLVMYSWLVA